MGGRWRVGTAALLALAGILVGAAAVRAADAGASGPFVPRAPYVAALLVDRDSGQVLFAANENLRWPPASMAKMMTLLIAMERVRDGELRMDDPVIASAWASKIGGSQVYLKEGEQFPLSALLESIVIASANDASVAVAERIAGTTDAFVALMNERAKALGMTDSEFHSVHGLPPGKGQSIDLMSARDLATLGRALFAFQDIRTWAAKSEAPFRDGALQMRNTNHLVRTYAGADGLKTGYTVAAGFEVTATATRDGLGLLAVVLGAPTKKGCFDEAAKLLTMGFAGWKSLPVAEVGAPVGGAVPVRSGDVASVTPVAAQTLRITLPRPEAATARLDVRVPAELTAPLARGQRVGEVVVVQGGKEIARVDAVSPTAVTSTSWLAGWW